MNDFFDATFAMINVQRAAMGLEPLQKPETCDCGKPATYFGMCDSCYHSAQISSKEEYSPEIFGAGEDD